jgi:hypothetical protein
MVVKATDTLVAQLCERLVDMRQDRDRRLGWGRVARGMLARVPAVRSAPMSNANATVAGEGDYRLSRNGRMRSVM